jgi:hypothetical protein
MKRQRELESNKRPKLRPRSRLMHMAGQDFKLSVQQKLLVKRLSL